MRVHIKRSRCSSTSRSRAVVPQAAKEAADEKHHLPVDVIVVARQRFFNVLIHTISLKCCTCAFFNKKCRNASKLGASEPISTPMAEPCMAAVIVVISGGVLSQRCRNIAVLRQPLEKMVCGAIDKMQFGFRVFERIGNGLKTRRKIR